MSARLEDSFLDDALSFASGESMTYEAIVSSLMRHHAFSREKAEATARRELGMPTIAAPDVDHDALEKVIEHACDVLMQELGFEVIKFSHPGKTKQTEGIADRRYYRRPRLVDRTDGRFLAPAIALWFEAKSGSGRHRPGQKLFEELVTACGEHYLVGTHEVLIDWLVAHAIARRVGDRLEPL